MVQLLHIMAYARGEPLCVKNTEKIYENVKKLVVIKETYENVHKLLM